MYCLNTASFSIHIPAWLNLIQITDFSSNVSIWEQAKFNMIHAMRNLTDFTLILCSSVFIFQVRVLWDKRSIYIVYNREAYEESEWMSELLGQTEISPPSNREDHFWFLFVKKLSSMSCQEFRKRFRDFSITGKKDLLITYTTLFFPSHHGTGP